MQLQENDLLLRENDLYYEENLLQSDRNSALLMILTKMNGFNKTHVGKNKMLIEQKGMSTKICKRVFTHYFSKIGPLCGILLGHLK